MKCQKIDCSFSFFFPLAQLCRGMNARACSSCSLTSLKEFQQKNALLAKEKRGTSLVKLLAQERKNLACSPLLRQIFSSSLRCFLSRLIYCSSVQLMLYTLFASLFYITTTSKQTEFNEAITEWCVCVCVYR